MAWHGDGFASREWADPGFVNIYNLGDFFKKNKIKNREFKNSCSERPWSLRLISFTFISVIDIVNIDIVKLYFLEQYSIFQVNFYFPTEFLSLRRNFTCDQKRHYKTIGTERLSNKWCWLTCLEVLWIFKSWTLREKPAIVTFVLWELRLPHCKELKLIVTTPVTIAPR